jgi:predicted nucleic acid-binding protein
MPYFDSAFVAKCYLPEPGHAAIVAFAEQSDHLATSLFARTEVVGVFHRKLREGSLTARDFREVLAQFQQDCRAGIWQFLPVSAEIVEAVVQSYARLPGAVFLRAADCLHLVTAREAGFAEIYSNDRHLLAGAAQFGLKGIDLSSRP